MPTIIPIPGANPVARLDENSRVLDLRDEEMDQIFAVLAGFTPAGESYHAFIAINTLGSCQGIWPQNEDVATGVVAKSLVSTV
jgi:hypothetical protein